MFSNPSCHKNDDDDNNDNDNNHNSNDAFLSLVCARIYIMRACVWLRMGVCYVWVCVYMLKNKR